MKEEDKESFGKFASDEFNAMIAAVSEEFYKRFPDSYKDDEDLFFYESILNQMAANLMAKVLCVSATRGTGNAHLELYGKYLDLFLENEMENVSLYNIVNDICKKKG